MKSFNPEKNKYVDKYIKVKITDWDLLVKLRMNIIDPLFFTRA
jgi:hypothetical protein